MTPKVHHEESAFSGRIPNNREVPSMGVSKTTKFQALGDDKTLILPEMPWRTHQRHSATALPGAGAAKYGYLGLVAKNTKGPTKSGSGPST